MVFTGFSLTPNSLVHMTVYPLTNGGGDIPSKTKRTTFEFREGTSGYDVSVVILYHVLCTKYTGRCFGSQKSGRVIMYPSSETPFRFQGPFYYADVIRALLVCSRSGFRSRLSSEEGHEGKIFCGVVKGVIKFPRFLVLESSWLW